MTENLSKLSISAEETERGLAAREAITAKFADQSRITLQELGDFMKAELGVKHPILSIVLGDGREIMQESGYISWYEEPSPDMKTPIRKWLGFERIVDPKQE
ncbi:hypothetical protein KKD37_00205 [Patescibacteria group bacterium]|nr:hypothetical protein [Patescibacteria group bacterium]